MAREMATRAFGPTAALSMRLAGETESSLEEEVLDGLAEAGGGKFDQCNTP